jgi:hypothetical protein
MRIEEDVDVDADSGWEYACVLALVATISAFFVAGQPQAPVGMMLLVAGQFLGMKATLRGVELPKGMPMNTIQKWRHLRKRKTQALGLFLSTIGVWIAFW